MLLIPILPNHPPHSLLFLYFLPIHLTPFNLFTPAVGPIFQDMWAGDWGEDKVMENAMEELFGFFFQIASSVEHVDESQWPLYEKLCGVYNGLSELKKSGKYDASDVSKFQDQLNDIDSKKVDGKFVDAKGEVPTGQSMLSTLLNKSYRLARQLLVNLEEK